MAIPLVILGYFVCFTSILVVAVFILLQLAATATVACVIAFKRNRCVANGCLSVCVCTYKPSACMYCGEPRTTYVWLGCARCDFHTFHFALTMHSAYPIVVYLFISISVLIVFAFCTQK